MAKHDSPGRDAEGRVAQGRDASASTSALRVVGRSLPKVDAVAKVTGRTRFADDLSLPRMLHCKMLRATSPHAEIRSMDVTAAAAMPGVAAVLVGADLPIPYGILPVSQDEHTLCLEKVRFIGDPVAAVAAIDEETAEAACRAIVVEYGELEPVVHQRPQRRVQDVLARPRARARLGVQREDRIVARAIGAGRGQAGRRCSESSGVQA